MTTKPPKPESLDDPVVYNFSAGRCNVCIRLNGIATVAAAQRLLQCGGCHLIGYCSREHQRRDWSQHREICRAVRRLLAKSDGNSQPARYLHEFIGQNLTSGAVRSHYYAVCTLSAKVLQSVLDRRLTYHESAMVWWPRVCYVCLREFEWCRLRPCERCNAVFFCHEERSECNGVIDAAVLKAKHSEYECEQLRLQCRLVVRGAELMKPIERPPKLELFAANVPFPDNLFELVRLSTDRSEAFNENPSTDYEIGLFAAVSNLSFVATLLAALRQTILADGFAASDIFVHIPGADSEVVLFTEHECWLLFRWLPANVTDVHLDFVGPDITSELNDVELVHCYGQRSVRQRFFRTTYERCDQLTASAPDLCIAFNAGTTNDDNSTGHVNPWLAGLERILRTCRFFAQTSYVDVERQLDLSLLRQVADRLGMAERLTEIYSGVNGHRDARPYRHKMSDTGDGGHVGHETIYFINGYLTVVGID